MVGAVHFVWGLNGPVATMAGQVQAESSWNNAARSAYASGLAQFTPSTADWASKTWPDLGPAQPLEPAWALRALAQYDQYLFVRNITDSPCDQWGFTLSAYNGGQGNLNKDKALAKDPTRWFGSVELHSKRNAQAFAENRAYPRKILLNYQQLYVSWGPTVSCQGIH